MSSDKLLPSFFVVGAQKAGTTTLHHRLLAYPEISLPITKETHFFSSDEKFERGYDWYLEQFRKLVPNGIRGEVAPDYMFSEVAAYRISQSVKAPKLIFMLRHPIDRAYSNYLMTRRQGKEGKSFLEALLQEKERLKLGDPVARNYFSYLARSEYSRQIRTYRKYFPDSPMHFVLFEDFIDEGAVGVQVYQNIISFLGLKKFLSPDFSQKENVASEPRFVWLRNFLYGSTKFKRLIGKAIPNPNLRERIAYRLDMLNQKPTISSPPAVPEFVIQWCENETAELSKLIEMDLSKWNLITKNYSVKHEKI